METEVWKDVPWGIGRYQASSLGRVRSLDKVVRCNKTGKRNSFGRNLKPSKNRGGYLMIECLMGVTPLVHRIVAGTFIPNPENKPWVNHKNGNKADNRVENLEWLTISENVQHAYNNGLNWAHKGESCPFSKLKEVDVLKIRELSKLGSSNVSIAERFNITQSHVGKIVSRKIWRHLS